MDRDHLEYKFLGRFHCKEEEMFTDNPEHNYQDHINSDMYDEILRLRKENENLAQNAKTVKKLIMRTSEAVSAYEDMERQRDEIKEKYDKVWKENSNLKAQHFLNQLNNPKVVSDTINLINNDDIRITELQEAHDQECNWKVYSKLKHAIDEVDLIKRQQSNKLQQEIENAKRLKELEKKWAAQEKTIYELRKVIETWGKLRSQDQDKIEELEHIQNKNSSIYDF